MGFYVDFTKNDRFDNDYFREKYKTHMQKIR